MRSLHHEVLRVVSKKRKAADGGEGTSRRRHRSRPRSPPQTAVPTPPARTSADRQQPRAEGEVVPIDLTADIPPKGPRAESPPTVAPHPSDAAPAHSAAEPDVEPVVRASPPAERAPAVPVGGSAPNAAPSAPARVEADEGDALTAIPSRPSLMNQGRLAERLVSQTLRPDFRRELHRQGANSFFRDMAVAQMTNSVAVMREVLSQAEVALSQAQGEAAELRTRAEGAEGELARVRLQLDAARDNVFARDARLDSLSTEMRAVEARALSAEGRVQGLEKALAGEKAAKQAAEEKASAAEGRATNAESRAEAAEGRAIAAEGKATAAEEKTAAAEKMAAAAVEEYERSPAFITKMAEASAEVYLYGFRDGKEKVGRVYDLSGLDGIEPDEAPEEQAASPEPAGDEAGPSDT